MKKQKNYSRKLFGSYSILLIGVLLPLFLALMIFVYRQQYQRSVDTQMELAVKTQSQLDASLKSMDRIINGLLFNDDFLDMMGDPQAADHSYEYTKKVTGILSAQDAPLFSTHRIIAFNRDIYYTFGKPTESPEYIAEAIRDFPWWATVLKANGTKVFLPVHQDLFDPKPQLVYSVSRAVIVRGECLGLIEVQNKYEQLERICRLDSAAGKAAVFSQDGQLIYPQDAGEDAELLALLYQETLDASASSFQSEKQQLSYVRSDYSGWTTLVYAPTARLVPYARAAVGLSLGAFLILAIVSLFMNYLLTRRLTAPLLDLKEAVEQVSIGNLSLTLPDSHGIVEIDAINRSFETMFRQLEEAIAQSIQSRSNEERANYLALQSQMNPHTLYNTIGMIESVSYIHGDREVSNLCICFSHMLRYISDYTKRTYTVGDELQHLGDYATLTMKRYEGKLTITSSCPEELTRQELPKFTIQPLVENAVKHGFGAGCSVLTVEVRVSPIPGGWQILVKDSGQGFAPGRIEELKKQFIHCDECLAPGGDVVNQKIGNLALSNIYIRCRLQFGAAFHIQFGNNEETSGGFVALNFLTEEETK